MPTHCINIISRIMGRRLLKPKMMPYLLSEWLTKPKTWQLTFHFPAWSCLWFLPFPNLHQLSLSLINFVCKNCSESLQHQTTNQLNRQHGSKHKNYQYKPSTDSHSNLTSGIFATVLFFLYLKLKKNFHYLKLTVKQSVSFFNPALMMNAS